MHLSLLPDTIKVADPSIKKVTGIRTLYNATMWQNKVFPRGFTIITDLPSHFCIIRSPLPCSAYGLMI